MLSMLISTSRDEDTSDSLLTCVFVSVNLCIHVLSPSLNISNISCFKEVFVSLNINQSPHSLAHCFFGFLCTLYLFFLSLTTAFGFNSRRRESIYKQEEDAEIWITQECNLVVINRKRFPTPFLLATFFLAAAAINGEERD